MADGHAAEVVEGHREDRLQQVLRWAQSSERLVALKRRIERHVVGENRQRVLEGLPAFLPNAMGGKDELVDLTLLAARDTFPLVMELIERSGQNSVDVVDVCSYPANDIAAGAAAASLGALFDSYGSDKASAHDYHHFYASILQPGTPRSLLEIGLGTNNTDVVATMGAQGRPGASLRAFRDHLPGAHIFGADVDERVLFTEERIKTCRVDQIDRESFENVTAMIGGQVDVVIDDGLHAPNANLAVLHYAFDVLAPDGWLVIEDIASASVPIWQVVAALMPANFDCTIVQARDGLLFTAHRTS